MINSAELTARLPSAGVPADAYSVGSDRDEAYCLIHDGDRWSVYYSERGRRTDEVRHPTEAEACADLVGRLTGDHIVQSRRSKGQFDE